MTMAAKIKLLSSSGFINKNQVENLKDGLADQYKMHQQSLCQMRHIRGVDVVSGVFSNAKLRLR